MNRRILARAVPQFEANLDVLRRASGGEAERVGPLDARVVAANLPPVRVTMVASGRVFGGTADLEVATASPVLPPTRGVVARGRGLVRMRGVSFRAAGGDEAGRRTAALLEADTALAAALSAVHFHQVRVDPDGRAVIRHMGGCLVWMLLPPLVRGVPFVPEQARATLAALVAFSDVQVQRGVHRRN